MTAKALATWLHLVEARETSGLANLLDEDIVLFSPIVQTPQRGKQDALVYLTGAFKVFFNDSYHYVKQFIDSNEACLEFETEIDGTLVNGIDMIKWNECDKIVEIKVMLRPLNMINKIHQDMAVKLKTRQV